MARAVWSGAISFGLVSVPVKAVGAVKSHDFKANQLNSKTGHRVLQKRVDASTGDEVPYEDIVKGYEVSKGMYVTLSADELTALTPKSSKTIEIDGFVDPAEVDLLLAESHYYLEPEEHAAKSYALLSDAMSKDKVAIGRVSLRSREYPCMIRNTHTENGDVMVMTILNYPDEIVDPAIVTIPQVEIAAKEKKMAKTLVENMTIPFDVSEYKDRYTDALRQAIETKMEGKKIVATPDEPAVGLDDLMAALEASLAKTKKKAKTA